MSNQMSHYEVHFTQQPPVHVFIYGIEQDGQFVHVASQEFGPFDTSLEVAQWVWRCLCRDIDSRKLLR